MSNRIVRVTSPNPDPVTVTLPRDVALIVFKVLEHDALNVDFDDDGEYDAAINQTLDALTEELKK